MVSWLFGMLAASLAMGQGSGAMAMVVENQHVRIGITEDGRVALFEDLATGSNHVAGSPALASVRRAGETLGSTAATYAGGQLRLGFGDGSVSATLAVRVEPRYVVLEVESVEGEGVEELVICDIPLTLAGTPDEPLAACALALNLQTNVLEFPGPNSRLRAICYPRFGMEGSSVAVVACPAAEMRDVLKEVVLGAPDLPHSPIGGPWALEGPLNRSSYVFNYSGLSEATVGDWIAQVQSLGFNQVEFHGGGSFRFGDCALDPNTYPNGRASLRAVIDRLHEAGIYAGLHPYAFFIDKRSEWVTPVPHPGLAYDAVFTLADDISEEANFVPVVESTGAMHTTTGFFVRNSITLRVDEELIVYRWVQKEPPFGFAECIRGAHGTTATAHQRGAKAYHLKECFGLFAPDPESALFYEVVQRLADFYNDCDFDTIYLDALDGSDVLGRPEDAWYHGSRFVFELWKRLRKPAVMEMSSFTHHLWYVRSRMGAWDCPTRSHKRFIDMHVQANEMNTRMFLPSNLGWWGFFHWGGTQTEPTFPDDIEYLCCKALGTDSGLSVVVYNPAAPGDQRLAAIMRRYETLRHSGRVPEHVKALLRTPGEEYTLEEAPGGASRIVPVTNDRHTVGAIDGISNVWHVENRYAPQVPSLRVQALSAAAPYDSPDSLVLEDFGDPDTLTARGAAAGVTMELVRSDEPAPGSAWSGRITARSELPSRTGSWAHVTKLFDPPLALGERQALGVWVHGDGKGEVLNFQLRSPDHITTGIGEHYVVVDFEGWRYFELIEFDSDRFADYAWPYGWAYPIYREHVEYGAVSSLGIWINNLPPGEEVTCYLGAVRALPLASTALTNPTVSVGGASLVFPVELVPGAYIEYSELGGCTLYAPNGSPVGQIEPEGDTPVLVGGANEVVFSAGSTSGANPRARVMVTARGEPVWEG